MPTDCFQKVTLFSRMTAHSVDEVTSVATSLHFFDALIEVIKTFSDGNADTLLPCLKAVDRLLRTGMAITNLYLLSELHNTTFDIDDIASISAIAQKHIENFELIDAIVRVIFKISRSGTRS